jgi:hypothetical protein
MSAPEPQSALTSGETTLVNTPEPQTPPESLIEEENVATKAIRKVEEIVLYAFHESPMYQRDNHYILSGYRGELRSFKRCFGSLLYLHNESGIHFSFGV